MNILEDSEAMSLHVLLPMGDLLHAWDSTPLGWSQSLAPGSLSPAPPGFHQPHSPAGNVLFPVLFPLFHIDQRSAQDL